MSKNKYIYITSVAVLCAYCGIAGSAVMSKYGEIQSVKNYSSNPFWTPDSPYNLRIPSPIYATGPDLNTETCNNTVAALVSSYCSANNNCSNKQLSDVRPTIMVQLSQLPGANYATSCGGYIDSAFKNYKKNHGNLSTGINIVQTNKPKTTLTLNTATKSTKTTKTDGVAERTAELERLQNITTPSSQLTAEDFPKTIADISFVDRVANATAGYEPYKDLKAYKIPKFETEQEYYARMESVLKHDINYETYKGKPTKQSPTSYLTGRGAKIAWSPSRDYSIFKGWCADESLTLKPDECDTNCQMTPTVDPMDRADKMFYACWECEAGHELKNHQCGCPDPDYMDPKKDCDCTLQLPGLLQKTSDGMKCECKNGMDITSGCKCVGPYTTQNPATHQCECVSPYTQVDSSDINKGCKCIDPNGDPANNCQVTCPDENMDPNDGCKCMGNTKRVGNECVCKNGAGNPPDCTCPDPNMTDISGTCKCESPYKTDPSDSNECICEDPDGNPTNGCRIEYSFVLCGKESGAPVNTPVNIGSSNLEAQRNLACYADDEYEGFLEKCISICPEPGGVMSSSSGALNNAVHSTGYISSPNAFCGASSYKFKACVGSTCFLPINLFYLIDSSTIRYNGSGTLTFNGFTISNKSDAEAIADAMKDKCKSFTTTYKIQQLYIYVLQSKYDASAGKDTYEAFKRITVKD